MDSNELIKNFISLIVITNPFANLPIFLSLTANDSPKEQRRQAVVCGVAVSVILLISVWVGLPLLGAFGIHIPAFSIAGGLIILLMALSMLHSDHSKISHTPEEHAHGQEKESVAIVPLAIPILAGPGAISTVIHMSDQAGGVEGRLGISAVVLAVTFCLVAVLFFADRIGKAMGPSALKIATRIMGMLLTAIAIEMLIGGLSETFPILKTAG